MKEVLRENRKTLTELLEIDKSCRYSRSWICPMYLNPPKSKDIALKSLGIKTGQPVGRPDISSHYGFVRK